MLPTPSPSHDPHLDAHDAEGKTEGEAMQQAHDAEGLFERQGIGNDESSGASEMSGARGHEWSSTWEEDRSWVASQPRAVQPLSAAQRAAGGPSLYPAAGSCLHAPGPPPPPPLFATLPARPLANSTPNSTPPAYQFNPSCVAGLRPAGGVELVDPSVTCSRCSSFWYGCMQARKQEQEEREA